MKHLHGQFESYNDHSIYDIHIYNQNGSGELVIGTDDIYFASDPLTITINADDEFTHVIKKSANIRIVSQTALYDYLFANTQEDVIVEIYQGQTLIFKGYVEPNIYSQPYANKYDEIDINCLDYLSILQYKKLSDVSNYNTYKSNAGISSFADILDKMGLSYAYHDGTRRIDGTDIFNDVGVSELIFLGETEDKEMTCEEILQELMQYLNLHIIQEGNVFYIFDWNMQGESIDWYNIYNGQYVNTIEGDAISILKDDYAGSSTNITVADVYNQIQLKCSIEKLETVVESPLDSSNIYDQYSNYQKFMTEIYCGLDTPYYNSQGIEAFANFMRYVSLNADADDTSKYWIRDWFFRIKNNSNWIFRLGSSDIYNSEYETDSSGQGINQWKFLKYLRDHRFASCLASFAKGNKRQPSDIDGSLTFEDALIISINGQNLIDQQSALDSYAQGLYALNGPIIEYVGNSNGVYSPNDDGTTNYLVFSGKFTYVPSIGNTGLITNDMAAATAENKYTDTKALFDQHINSEGEISIGDWANDYRRYTMPYNNNPDYGCYYLNKYWTQEKTIREEATIANPYYNYYYPLLDLSNIQNKYIKYNLSKIGGTSYKIDKVPVLECELKIGDKYCVETFVQGAGGDYRESTFGWYTYDNCPYEDGVKKTTFSLGFRPNIVDSIIGKEFSIQTNFDYTWNIGATDGTAIPITREDNLQGEVSFKILGPINSTWDIELTRNKNWWEYIFNTSSTKSILNYVSSIMIKDFECKIYSDNNGYNNNSDNDLIYMSDVDRQYIKKKDDIEFKINTALTSDEANQFKITNTVNLSSVVNMNTGYALDKLGQYSWNSNVMTRDEYDKPEKLYCNYYYNICHTPKIELETDVIDGPKFNYFNIYHINYMNKDFRIISSTKNAGTNILHLKLKEI